MPAKHLGGWIGAAHPLLGTEACSVHPPFTSIHRDRWGRAGGVLGPPSLRSLFRTCKEHSVQHQVQLARAWALTLPLIVMCKSQAALPVRYTPGLISLEGNCTRSGGGDVRSDAGEHVAHCPFLCPTAITDSSVGAKGRLGLGSLQEVGEKIRTGMELCSLFSLLEGRAG